MLKDAVRVMAELVALPVGAVGRSVRSMITGPRAILDLDLHRKDDVVQRQRLVHHLRRAAGDPCVAGVLLRIHGTPGSWAAGQDLRAAFALLRRNGRKVYALVEAPGNAETWLASAADRIFLAPTGEVNLLGVGVELTFYGNALQKLGVEPDFEAAGAYKSFGEPYTRSFASPANQEAVRDLVDDLHAQLLADIAEARGLTVEEVQRLVERAPLSASEAKEAGLVDDLLYEDQVIDWLEEHHGSRSRRVAFDTWARWDALLDWTERAGEGGGRVAVVHLEGPIVLDDRGPSLMIRARKVVPVLRHLREDDGVSAVVLHVNSPGGSALASDLIWREVDLLQRAKPVVAAFEGVAASGGYYLSAPAAEILARPGTLTGSIGVFGGKLVMGEGLRRIGVTTQEITAAPNANLFSPSRHFSDAQRERFRSTLQRFYDGFVQRVAAGRRRKELSVEPYCRGRVWTGRAARDCGLIDRYGDLYDAVDRARALAGLRPGAFRRIDVAPAHNRTLLGRLLAAITREMVPGIARSRIAIRLLGGGASPEVELLLRHEGQPIAMLPFVLEPR